ncbi:hypothetical protein DERP_007523 [Dermatophagoides pteronyssinus]|uniref:Uncharacterized protein n=1 Tax=Dermatophagoides pteronyssinus TaxID=6956 RepID=A0ABQ8J4M4_DERPT|nr:hypothetical protein DERP_007523 [Dermatophagoides pteronyssinus]
MRLDHREHCAATFDSGINIATMIVVVDDDNTIVRYLIHIFPSYPHTVFSDWLFLPMVYPKDRMECPDQL